MTSDDALGWQAFNLRWESRLSNWNTPTDYSDASNQILYTEQVSMLYRYSIMLYYALVNLGLGEMGPVNFEEYIFCVISMIISAFVFSIIFSQILSVYSQLIFEALTH